MRVAVQRPTESWEFHSTGFAGSTPAMQYAFIFTLPFVLMKFPVASSILFSIHPAAGDVRMQPVEFQDSEFALWVHGDWLRDDDDEVHEEEVCSYQDFHRIFYLHFNPMNVVHQFAYGNLC